MNRSRIHTIRIIAFLSLAMVASMPAWSQLMQLRLVTSAYSWEQKDTDGTSATHVFGYQTMQFGLAGEHLSFHTYLQGFNDFSGPLKNNGRLRMNNFYLRYAGLADRIDLSLGRQMVFGGVGNGSIDGLTATARFMDDRLKVLGYYGMLPAPRYEMKLTEDADKNWMAGARVTGSPTDFLQISVSYLQKSMQPQSYWRDSLNEVLNVAREIRPAAMSEKLLGGDATFDKGIISGYARYAFNVETEKSDQIQLFTRVQLLKPLAITAEYLRREPRLSFNSIFWAFTLNPVIDIEGGWEYSIGKSWQLFAKYGTILYGADEKSDRLTIGTNWTYFSGSIGMSTGDAGELKSFALNAGYPLCENKFTPTLSASYAQYKLSEDSPEDGALSIGAGAVCRPLPALSLDAQVQLMTNKIYSNDVRVFFRASYQLSNRLNLF